MSGADDGGFLSRWSRRKRDAAREPERPPVQEPAAPEPADPEPAAPEQAAAPARPDAPASACPAPEPEFDLASLPKLEELTTESDVSAFLRPGVPAALRSAALRRIWSLDPAIRDFIGCVDYQWDFNTPGGLPFGFANELGGDVKKLLAQAIGKLDELEAEERAAAAPDGATQPPEGAAPAGQAAPAPSLAAAPDAETAGAEATTPAPAAMATPPGPLALPGPGPGAGEGEPMAIPEAPAVPRRRHGGALPG